MSQILPIVTDLLANDKRGTLLIQQPEVHLHPRAQAAFGKLIFEAQRAGQMLVIETHSDFIINRYRIEQSKQVVQSECTIFFFETDPKTFVNVSHEISVTNVGNLNGAPDSYRNFFISEEIDAFEYL